MTLKQLRQLLAEATPGKWRPCPGDEGSILGDDSPGVERGWDSRNFVCHDAGSDALLIAALRNAADDLLDIAERAASMGPETPDNFNGQVCRFCLNAAAWDTSDEPEYPDSCGVDERREHTKKWIAWRHRAVEKANAAIAHEPTCAWVLATKLRGDR